jgi:hypothetical protein
MGAVAGSRAEGSTHPADGAVECSGRHERAKRRVAAPVGSQRGGTTLQRNILARRVATRRNKKRCNAAQRRATQRNNKRCDAAQRRATQCYKKRCNAVQRVATQRNIARPVCVLCMCSERALRVCMRRRCGCVGACGCVGVCARARVHVCV